MRSARAPERVVESRSTKRSGASTSMRRNCRNDPLDTTPELASGQHPGPLRNPRYRAARRTCALRNRASRTNRCGRTCLAAHDDRRPAAVGDPAAHGIETLDLHRVALGLLAGTTTPPSKKALRDATQASSICGTPGNRDRLGVRGHWRPAGSHQSPPPPTATSRGLLVDRGMRYPPVCALGGAVRLPGHG